MMNRVTDLLNIQHPIIQGGMGNISNAKLAAAVSEAGGLGTIGCGTMPPDEVEEIILQTKQLTEKPFSLNIAINVTPHVDELLALSVKHQVPVVSLSAGNPSPYIPFLHEHHKIVLAVVASVSHAQKAEAAGADILVAEGYEAAGINSILELTTFTLIPQVVQKVQIPVIAAGGIGDGKGLAAAFMLGAEGVQIGTRLIATQEAPFHDTYKQQLLQASGTDAIIIGRSVGTIRRVLTTPYVKKLQELEKKGMSMENYRHYTSEERHVVAALEGEVEQGFLNSGQIAGLVEDVPSVQELLNDMVNGAKKQLAKGMNLFG